VRRHDEREIIPRRWTSATSRLEPWSFWKTAASAKSSPHPSATGDSPDTVQILLADGGQTVQVNPSQITKMLPSQHDRESS
jgi:hypothetical protein